MALKLYNRKIYPWPFAGSVVASVALWYWIYGLAHGRLLLGLVAAIATFFYFLYKQHLDEARLFKELFVELNRRYDRLNNRLNKIVRGDRAVPLKEEERGVVFDYFNLCAEEYFFYQAQCIDETVWKAWRRGMVFFFNNARIRDLWNEDCRSADELASYYGFEPPPYEGDAIFPVSSAGAHATKAVVDIPRYSAGTWQAEAQRAGLAESGFSVDSHFSNAPPLSVVWSQRFVETALSYRDVTAFVNGPGVGFDPNFVYIERVYTEDEGFIGSFYGTVEQFRQYDLELEPGRNPATYSRLRVKSADLLEQALKCLHISASLKDLNRA